MCIMQTRGYLWEKHYLLKDYSSQVCCIFFLKNQVHRQRDNCKRYSSCKTDLDEPPDTVHYALNLGSIDSGELFEQVPSAENFI